MPEDDFSRCKIAIVDSDNLFCQQLQACLRSAGFQVEYERNAHTGLKKIKSWKPHIVVSDYIVHGMDYFDFAQAVEAMPFKTQMVVVSSHYLDGPLSLQLTNLSRVILIVQKPIKPRELLNKIIELVPQVDFTEPIEPPEPIDSNADYSLDDKDLQQEIARLQFEAKELPRFLASLKALTSMAREQPHKSQYLREALEQSKRTFEEVRRQRLPHLEAPIEKVTHWLQEIIENGSLPSLNLWDCVLDELNSLSEPKHRIGTATMPDFDTEETGEFEFTRDIQNLLPISQDLVPAPLVKPRLTVSPHGQKFLLIGTDPREELLNLARRYGVSVIIKEKLEQAQEACQSATFDLVLLLLSASLSGERARDAVASTHEMLREIETYSQTPLVVLSEAESMHTRIVTAHHNHSYWLSWSEMRKNDTEFLTLKAIAAESGIRPSVLIVDSDVSDSEELLRELSRKCSRVDTGRDPEAVIKVICENRPDVILVSERTGDVSGFDLCRAISSCLSFESITIILQVNSIDAGTLKGAFRAGADGIICKSETTESRVEIMLKIWRRCSTSRKVSVASPKPFEVSADIRASLEQGLKKSIEEQLPLTVCLIDLSDSNLTCDDVARDWKSRQNEIAQNTTAVHYLSQKLLLISCVGLRKTIVARILQEMLETYRLIAPDSTTDAFVFRCRSYPDDALSLSDLLESF